MRFIYCALCSVLLLSSVLSSAVASPYKLLEDEYRAGARMVFRLLHADQDMTVCIVAHDGLRAGTVERMEELFSLAIEKNLAALQPIADAIDLDLVLDISYVHDNCEDTHYTIEIAPKDDQAPNGEEIFPDVTAGWALTFNSSTDTNIGMQYYEHAVQPLVVLHEVGHLLGLIHSSDARAIMNLRYLPVDGDGPAVFPLSHMDLMPDDIAGVQAVYKHYLRSEGLADFPEARPRPQDDSPQRTYQRPQPSRGLLPWRRRR